MSDQSSRFSGNTRRATLAVALIVAGLGVGAIGCSDDEDENVNEAIDSVQSEAQSVQSQAETAIDEAQEQGESVQSEADEALEDAQKQLEEEQQDDSGGSRPGY